MKAKIYTIDNCGFCEAAKSLLKNKNIETTEENLTGNDEAKVQLVQKTGQRTFPQIFLDDNFIGGYNELKNHLGNS